MKPTPNRYLSKIETLVGVRESKLAVQTFVNRLRGSTSSLDDLARNLGVEKIVEERLPFEGGLFQAADGSLVIKLNAYSSQVRKRFTLAHEVAHLLLGTIPGHRKAGHNDSRLERACDMIAAELLMPAEDVVQFVNKLGGPSPDNLKTIASAFDVSLRAAAIRLHSDLRVWKCCIGLWERDETVRTEWFVGPKRWDTTIPDSYSLDLAAESGKSLQLNETWVRNGSLEPVGLFLLCLRTNRESRGQRFLGLVSFLS